MKKRIIKSITTTGREKTIMIVISITQTEWAIVLASQSRRLEAKGEVSK